MQIAIQARGFELSPGLRNHTVQRLQFALGWAHHRLGRISVRLSDENGPRGGEDKRCSIRVGLDGAPDVVIEDIEADLYVAIDRAADRASRALARQLERKREHRHAALPARITDDATA